MKLSDIKNRFIQYANDNFYNIYGATTSDQNLLYMIVNFNTYPLNETALTLAHDFIEYNEDIKEIFNNNNFKIVAFVRSLSPENHLVMKHSPHATLDSAAGFVIQFYIVYESNKALLHAYNLANLLIIKSKNVDNQQELLLITDDKDEDIDAMINLVSRDIVFNKKINLLKIIYNINIDENAEFNSLLDILKDISLKTIKHSALWPLIKSLDKFYYIINDKKITEEYKEYNEIRKEFYDKLKIMKDIHVINFNDVISFIKMVIHNYTSCGKVVS